MNLNEIMERDIADAERQQGDRDERAAADEDMEARCDRVLIRILAVLIWIAVACAAFCAGQKWHQRRASGVGAAEFQDATSGKGAAAADK